MSNLFEITAQPYGVTIVCAFGISDAKLRKGLKPELRKSDAWKLGDNAACIDWLSPGTLIMRFRNPPTTPARHGTLAHEVFHATVMIMDWVGCKLCRQSEEAFAYLTQSITEKIYERLAG